MITDLKNVDCDSTKLSFLPLGRFAQWKRTDEGNDRRTRKAKTDELKIRLPDPGSETFKL